MPEPFVPVPATALCEIRYTLNAQHCENTLWFLHDGEPTTEDLDTLAEALYNWWHDELADAQSSDVKFVEVVCTSMDSEEAPVGSFAPLSAAQGSIATEAMPGNVSLSVSFRTGARGRSFRGRNYAIGIPISVVDSAAVTPEYGALLTTAYDQLIGESDFLAGWTWVIASRRHDNEPRVTGVTSPVTSVLLVDLTIDSMRRRLPGRGS